MFVLREVLGYLGHVFREVSGHFGSVLIIFDQNGVLFLEILPPIKTSLLV